MSQAGGQGEIVTMQKFFPAYDRKLSQEVRSLLYQEFCQTDRVLMILLGLHWLVVSTATAMSYGMYMLGIIGGGVTFGLSWIGYRFFKGSVISRLLIGISFMVFSAIMIQQHMGRIEMHFHVFVALSFLVLYRDIVPIVSAATTIALHHLGFNYLQLYDVRIFDIPIVVFNYGEGIGIVLVHAVFVIAQTLFLSFMILRMTERLIDDISVAETIRQVISEKNLTLRVKGGEEAKGINQFLDAMCSVFGTIHDQSEDVERTIRQLVGIRNELADGTRETSDIAKKVVDENHKLGEEISAISTSMANAFEHVTGISNAIREQAEDLLSVNQAAGSAQEVVTTLATSSENITGHLNTVGSNLDDVTHHVDQQSNSVRIIQENLENVRSLGSNANQEADRANILVQEIKPEMDLLIQSSREINNVVDTIKKIAAQTNMLALNAAIEAAGAGEAGMGFSVVANEVKDLSSQTTDATKLIARQVATINDHIENVSKANAALGSVVETLHTSNGKISTAVENQSVQIGGLTSSMESINAAVDMVSGNLQNLDSIAQELAATSVQASTDTQHLVEGVSSVNLSASEMADKSHEVEQLVQSVMSAASETDHSAMTIQEHIRGVFQQVSSMYESVSTLGNMAKNLEESGAGLQDIHRYYKSK